VQNDVHVYEIEYCSVEKRAWRRHFYPRGRRLPNRGAVPSKMDSENLTAKFLTRKCHYPQSTRYDSNLGATFEFVNFRPRKYYSTTPCNTVTSSFDCMHGGRSGAPARLESTIFG
jgi:hypothetical protein